MVSNACFSTFVVAIAVAVAVVVAVVVRCTVVAALSAVAVVASDARIVAAVVVAVLVAIMLGEVIELFNTKPNETKYITAKSFEVCKTRLVSLKLLL